MIMLMDDPLRTGMQLDGNLRHVGIICS
jgi:hypothetical protein